jgi:predicted esterase YcpF (UPF0227 family)
MRLASMSIETDTRDRVIRLEAKVEEMARQQAETNQKVTAMHELLMQARGAKYVIVGSAAIGGFLSAKLAHFLPWMNGNG